MSEFLQDPKAIKAWLGEMGIKKATLRYDNDLDSMVVDVDGGVRLDKKLGDLMCLPVQFGHVSGYFFVNNNQLTSLDGSPQTVGEHFDVSYNQLTSLKGASQKVGGFFDASYNQLTSLEGAPQNVGWSFNVSDNQLTSLKGASQTVGEGFYCANNPIKNLSGIGNIEGACLEIPSNLPDFGIAEKGFDCLEINGNDNIQTYITASLEAAKSIITEPPEPTLASIHIAQTTNEPNPLQTALINKNWAGFCDLIDDPATRGLYTERTKEALTLCSFDPRLSDTDRIMARNTLDYTSNVLAFEQERSMNGLDR
jgi:hypothetical protein